MSVASQSSAVSPAPRTAGHGKHRCAKSTTPPVPAAAISTSAMARGPALHGLSLLRGQPVPRVIRRTYGYSRQYRSLRPRWHASGVTSASSRGRPRRATNVHGRAPVHAQSRSRNGTRRGTSCFCTVAPAHRAFFHQHAVLQRRWSSAFKFVEVAPDLHPIDAIGVGGTLWPALSAQPSHQAPSDIIRPSCRMPRGVQQPTCGDTRHDFDSARP